MGIKGNKLRRDDEEKGAFYFRHQRQSTETHESNTDADARLCRKGKTAGERRLDARATEAQTHRAGLWLIQNSRTHTPMHVAKGIFSILPGNVFARDAEDLECLIVKLMVTL